MTITLELPPDLERRMNPAQRPPAAPYGSVELMQQRAPVVSSIEARGGMIEDFGPDEPICIARRPRAAAENAGCR